MVTLKNKQRFYLNLVGAVLQRTRSNAMCILTALVLGVHLILRSTINGYIGRT